MAKDIALVFSHTSSQLGELLGYKGLAQVRRPCTLVNANGVEQGLLAPDLETCGRRRRDRVAEECAQNGGGAGRDRSRVIPTLERGDDRNGRRDAADERGHHTAERLRFEAHAEGLAPCGVEARRDEQKAGGEGAQDRQHEQLDRRKVLRVGRRGVTEGVGPHQVDITPAGWGVSLSRLTDGARPGVEVGVYRDEQYGGVSVKYLLRPVAVVHVPVDDGHPRDACGPSARGSHSD
mmetsp:Transcript_17851/g.58363  ORF Transcript_17851/g.58363 Transcript_17851/m.58363 type:complete len:235 (-) Transcript_17851:424-1128(-)|eukprot:scaffold38791_cov258-Isochrysis_galbana.AAC.1